MRTKDNSTVDWIDEETEDLTQIKLRKLFDYNAKTGQLINKKSGKPVGCLDKSTGYIRYRFNGKNHRVHRLIWVWLHSDVPDGFIVDHGDNDRTNNRAKNLRLLSTKENNENIEKGNSNNQIGIRGVSQKGDLYIARITCSGKTINLGTFATPEQAGAEYLKSKELMHKGWSSRGI